MRKESQRPAMSQATVPGASFSRSRVDANENPVMAESGEVAPVASRLEEDDFLARHRPRSCLTDEKSDRKDESMTYRGSSIHLRNLPFKHRVSTFTDS